MIREIFIFIFGSIVGSFLNVCIYRMPLGQSIIRPRSFCPNCRKTIFWYDNIPLVSYLLLKGRCRFCKQVIRFRYFIVELLTASVFLLLIRHFGLSRDFFIYTALACGLIIISFIDIEHRVIPDEISVGGIVVGLLFGLLRSFDITHYTLHITQFFNYILGSFVGGGIIYLTGVIGNITLKKESMGGGDVKLLAMIGAFLGWKKAILTFFIAPLFGLIPGIILKIKRQDLIPYGPFLSLGAIVSILWGEKILGWLF